MHLTLVLNLKIIQQSNKNPSVWFHPFSLPCDETRVGCAGAQAYLDGGEEAVQDADGDHQGLRVQLQFAVELRQPAHRLVPLPGGDVCILQRAAGGAVRGRGQGAR